MLNTFGCGRNKLQGNYDAENKFMQLQDRFENEGPTL